MAEWSVMPDGCVLSSDAHTTNILLGRTRDSRSNYWSLWEYLRVRLKGHFKKVLFRVNMSAILLQHESPLLIISIIKFMTVLFLLSCILLTASQHAPKSPEYITTTGYNTIGKVPQKIAGPAVALLSPCISHCHQGETLQSHHCPQLCGCDPHHNNHSGTSPFQQTVLLPVSLYYYFYYPNLQLTTRGKTLVIQL